MTTLTKLRASVSPEAITKVTRIFNGTLDDIFNEIFQNGRRAGASRIAVSALHLDDACVITVKDDGAGIDDPAHLVSLGQSDWTDECRAREDPAGMGFFSLAGLDTVVSSTSASGSFSLSISGDAWTGEADIDVLPWQGPRGTTISFTFEAIRDGDLERVVKSAAQYFPLPVTYNGAPLPREKFLEGALSITEREGYRIGVFRARSIDHQPGINFHGLTLKHRLPTISEVHDASWGVKVDIVDAPELVLVLPARKEVFRNAALERLLDLCREAIFARIREQPFHRLSFDDWRRALTFDPDFPEAIQELLPWVQVCARDEYRELPAYLGIGTDAAIFTDANPCGSITFARALAVSRGEGGDLESHRIASPVPIAFFAPESQFKGYSWYDALPQYTCCDPSLLETDGSPIERSEDQATYRPHRIVLHLQDGLGSGFDLETDFWIEEDDSSWNDPDTALIALTQSSSLEPVDLAELIFDAVFCPSDDCDADSYDTQETRFRHDAAVRAHTILEGKDAATLAGIRMAFGDRIAWRIPHGRTLHLVWSNEAVSLELSPAAPVVA